MKTLFTYFTFLLVTIFTFSSKVNGKEIPIPFDSTSNKYAYVQVVEVDSAITLYDNARTWLIDKYLNQNFALDKVDEKIIHQGSFEIISTMKAGMGINIPYNYTIIFNVILEFKEDRYRYTLTNIKFSQNAERTTIEQSIENFIASSDEMGKGKKKMEKFIEDTCTLIDDKFKELIVDMKYSIESNDRKTDGW